MCLKRCTTNIKTGKMEKKVSIFTGNFAENSDFNVITGLSQHTIE
jgi:hypothetical protein